LATYVLNITEHLKHASPTNQKSTEAIFLELEIYA
jgi:hypothetical protein